VVRIRDDGVFDAPIDRLWKYIGDQMLHQHDTFTVTKMIEQKGTSMLMEVDLVNYPGLKGMHKETLRMTLNPPKSMDIEFVDGPQKGTRHTHVYTPMGDKTKVVVEGEFFYRGLDDAAVKKSNLAYFEKVFNEDNANVKKYR